MGFGGCADAEAEERRLAHGSVRFVLLLLLLLFFYSFLFALKLEAVKKWDDEGEAQSFAGCILVRNAEAMVRPEPLSRICFFTCSLICVGMIRTQKKRKRRREDESATKNGKKKT